MQELSLTQGNVRTTLLHFALPFLAASLLQFLYGAADMMIVGRFSDAAGIAAVSTGSGVMTAITNLVMGLTTGGTVLIGQYIGAGRKEDLNRTINTMFTLFTLMALGLTVLFALLTPAIITLMRVPGEAAVPATGYLFICSCGIVFITGYNMISAILRGMGDSKRPMYFVAVACLCNIVGDLILVGVFGMGAVGAAIATVAAQAISLLLSIAVLYRQNFPFHFNRASFVMRRDKVGHILRLGTPVALQNVLVSISFLIITAIVNDMGVNQAAAVGTVERIIVFCMMAPAAFSAALSALAAQNMGAGLPGRAKQGLWYSILFSLLCGIVLFALIELLPQQAVGLFTPEQEVIYHGSLYLRTYGIDCILVCFIFCLNGFFSGCGCTAFTMVNSLAATFLVRVPAVLFISQIPGATLFHIGLAAPAASCLQILIQLVYLKTGRWNQVLVERTQNM